MCITQGWYSQEFFLHKSRCMIQGWCFIKKKIAQINVHDSKMVFHKKNICSNLCACLKDGDLLKKSYYKLICMWFLKFKKKNSFNFFVWYVNECFGPLETPLLNEKNCCKSGKFYRINLWMELKD